MNWLTQEQKSNIKAEAIQKPTEEICGFVLESGQVVSVENIHEDKEFNFRIAPESIIKYEEKGIKGIWHTHTKDPNFSPTDQVVMRGDTLPWAVYCIATNTFTEADFSKPAPLLGRPFIYGIWDCYALVRDYLNEAGIELPQWPRGDYGEWELSDFREFDENWSNYNVKPVYNKDYQQYDIVCMNLGPFNGHIDHVGVFTDQGRTVLHHPANRLSKKHKWGQWMAQRTILVLRPAELWNSKP